MSTDKQTLIKKLLDTYYSTFNDTIPLKFLNLSEDDTINLLFNCIKNKTLFNYKDYFPEGAIL